MFYEVGPGSGFSWELDPGSIFPPRIRSILSRICSPEDKCCSTPPRGYLTPILPHRENAVLQGQGRIQGGGKGSVAPNPTRIWRERKGKIMEKRGVPSPTPICFWIRTCARFQLFQFTLTRSREDYWGDFRFFLCGIIRVAVSNNPAYSPLETLHILFRPIIETKRNPLF